jgi:hypothetical protein
MSTRDDIAQAYAKDCAARVQLPAWSVFAVAETYQGPERRAVPRDPVLLSHGSRVLPRQSGWLFAARAR